MHFVENEICHIYNKGNQNQKIFFNRGNYLYFLKKASAHLCPCTDIIGWLLLPNCFHFIIHATENTCVLLKKSRIPMQLFSEGIRVMLSGYTSGVNKQRRVSGNLFQQRTHSKSLTNLSCYPPDAAEMFTEDANINIYRAALNYLHQLPVRRGYVKEAAEWEFSSYRDYTDLRKGGICNVEIGRQWFDVQAGNIQKEVDMEIPDEVTELFYHRKNWL